MYIRFVIGGLHRDFAHRERLFPTGVELPADARMFLAPSPMTAEA